jgi:RimJ/RimL family protein N-acetyltransferase
VANFKFGTLAMQLLFQRIDRAEAERLADWLSSDRWPFFMNPTPTRENILKRIDDGQFLGEGEEDYWIVDAAGDRIGLIELYDLFELAPMFNIRLRAAYRGRSLGPLAVRWLTRHVFENFPDKRRIEAQTREDNVAMRKVFNKCGYIKEAYYRQGSPTEGGGFVASVGYGILREDWLSGKVTSVAWIADDFFSGDRV